ncbi:MAG: hypothetical protein OXC81_04325 [Betaproteobacteria bacterium]|nr:hypothetical protein [Betaproteobacteria bacterium]
MAENSQPAVPATSAEAKPEPQPNGAGETMLQVDFIAGRIRLPLAKLAEWVPQYTLGEEGVFYPRIQALCNGAVIAEGELVEADGSVCFRVLKVLRPV